MGSWLKGAWEPKFSVPSLQLPSSCKIISNKTKISNNADGQDKVASNKGEPSLLAPSPWAAVIPQPARQSSGLLV